MKKPDPCVLLKTAFYVCWKTVLSVMLAIKVILPAPPLPLCLSLHIKSHFHLHAQPKVYRNRHLLAAVNIVCMFGRSCFLCFESFETNDDAS